jgi:hypothetical protein
MTLSELRPKQPVACITQAGHDVAYFVQALVNGGDVDGNIPYQLPKPLGLSIHIPQEGKLVLDQRVEGLKDVSLWNFSIVNEAMS